MCPVRVLSKAFNVSTVVVTSRSCKLDWMFAFTFTRWTLWKELNSVRECSFSSTFSALVKVEGGEQTCSISRKVKGYSLRMRSQYRKSILLLSHTLRAMLYDKNSRGLWIAISLSFSLSFKMLHESIYKTNVNSYSVLYFLNGSILAVSSYNEWRVLICHRFTLFTRSLNAFQRDSFWCDQI